MSFFEWLGRVIMLVLAGMITLSIISALAAISSTTVPQQLGIERVPQPVPPAEEDVIRTPRPAPRPAPRPDGGEQGAPTTPGGEMVAAPAPPKPADLARWLEAITYALLALAGLAALGCLLLWRLVHQQRRIADALAAQAYLPPAGSAVQLSGGEAPRFIVT
jgi:hypothetical protein